LCSSCGFGGPARPTGHPRKQRAEGAPFAQKMVKLRRFNVIMGFLHFLQAIAIMALSNGYTLPIFSNFLNFANNNGTLEITPDPQVLWNVPFGIGVGIFLLISALTHFYLATLGYKRYVENMRKNINPVRFYEYALSSSLMIVLIGMLNGIYDVAAIILLFTVNAAMNLFGIVMELHNQHTKKTDWTAFTYGSIAGIVPWIVIMVYFIGTINTGEAKPPGFVYAIIPILFVFFNMFAINMILQYKKIGKWRDYLYGERAYIILSLGAKTVLAWLVFSGTLR
jgi:hypothetical protein